MGRENKVSTMRTFKYQDQEGLHTISEEDIRSQYYPYWKERMENIGKGEEATFENCVEDFIVVNWADEVK